MREKWSGRSDGGRRTINDEDGQSIGSFGGEFQGVGSWERGRSCTEVTWPKLEMDGPRHVSCGSPKPLFVFWDCERVFSLHPGTVSTQDSTKYFVHTTVSMFGTVFSTTAEVVYLLIESCLGSHMNMYHSQSLFCIDILPD